MDSRDVVDVKLSYRKIKINPAIDRPR